MWQLLNCFNIYLCVCIFTALQTFVQLILKMFWEKKFCAENKIKWWFKYCTSNGKRLKYHETSQPNFTKIMSGQRSDCEHECQNTHMFILQFNEYIHFNIFLSRKFLNRQGVVFQEPVSHVEKKKILQIHYWSLLHFSTNFKTSVAQFDI